MRTKLILLITVCLLGGLLYTFIHHSEAFRTSSKNAKQTSIIIPEPTLKTSMEGNKTNPQHEVESIPDQLIENNSKIYESKKYHYSFRYPINWEIIVNTPESNEMSRDPEFVVVGPTPLQSYMDGGVSVRVVNFYSSQLSITSLEEYLTKIYQTKSVINNLEIVETTFAKEKAIKDKNGTLYVEHDNYLYEISWTHSGIEDTTNIESYYKSITPTFRFTK